MTGVTYFILTGFLKILLIIIKQSFNNCVSFIIIFFQNKSYKILCQTHNNQTTQNYQKK